MATARQCRERPAPTQRIDDPRTVVLVGLMGAGKSCVGRRLAARLERPFVDTDDEIVKAAGLSITDIFSVYGEAAFRDCERKVMARLLEGPSCVLAAGGGAFIAPQTRALIRARAVSVWLRADLDVLVARTAGRTHRPLLNTGDPRAKLKALMDDRYPVYAEADITVPTGTESADRTTAQVLEAVRDFVTAHPAGEAPPA
ncbi:shikimate kinase [Roseospira goensis]|uniref:Shikimate kinase n=1 Tax=Roseospira goensis TaxID=391922 RepID=A0A7W6S2M8_9PROT|nr:shikimate kinase [Roseospira goensis]MBB4287275.1 shikimate kinase [Roseospira goensis]